MNCAEIETNDVDERYLLGTLSGEEQEAYEAHFFECDRCFRRLEDLRALREGLAHDAGTSKPTQQHYPWILMAAIAASLLVVGIGLSLFLSASHREVRLAELASIEAPSYQPVQLRGASGPGQDTFRRAMGLYAAGAYSEALPDLEAAAALEPGSVRISFYLGACSLIEGRAAQGIENLERVIAAGSSPYLEESLLLLGQTCLMQEDVDGARARLQQLAAIDGDLGPEARRLLSEVDRLTD